jgi:hypothetical protein
VGLDAARTFLCLLETVNEEQQRCEYGGQELCDDDVGIYYCRGRCAGTTPLVLGFGSCGVSARVAIGRVSVQPTPRGCLGTS